jgi:ribokinase
MAMSAAVIVVGSLNVDLVVRVPRLPGAGETVIGGAFSRAHGGKGANQAAAAAALGARTWMVGLVGDDDLGRETRADLERRGVDLSQLGIGAAHTGVALIVVDERGENLIAVASGANAELTRETVAAALATIEEPSAVVLANLEIPNDAVLGAALAASERGWRFVLNPAPARALAPEIVRRCEVMIPNEHEAGELGWPSVDALLEAGAGVVVVTRGGAGADLHRTGSPRFHQDPLPAHVVDTTGAGDAFCGAFAATLAEGAPIEAALRAAVAGGALATRAVGARASLADRAALDEALTTHPGTSSAQPPS